jgi:hypothetical protein
MMQKVADIQAAKWAAVEVLLHNAHGPFDGLPRTAGWGYPEPYTRDLLVCALGVLISGSEELISTVRNVLLRLAGNQSRLGHIPSLVHDPEEKGASDTTPLFILITCIYRRFTGECDFCEEALERAMRWMEYQSADDRVLVTQLPTSDWRDEQWVLGYGLFVNTIVFSYLHICGQHERASILRRQLHRFMPGARGGCREDKPYYSLWTYKVYESQRFDLLGNSLAILGGLCTPECAKKMIDWIEEQCVVMRQSGDLAVNLPPNLFPFIRPGEDDWIQRYAIFNNPGDYHNGGIWPFICGFYIAALVSAGFKELAAEKLGELARIVEPARKADVAFGFNEWIKAQDGKPHGQDWQSWSAAMYLYACYCVEHNTTPFFDEIRRTAYEH